ncbi:hypothetical protein SOPP22_00610 [Shewanella sp. OPT22]|nr:hypothetical protein SOPP22_00610 [Shewanella sp. OPT22]
MSNNNFSIRTIVSEAISITIRKKLDVLIATTPLVIVFSLIFALYYKIMGKVDGFALDADPLSEVIPDLKYFFLIFMIMIYGFVKAAVNCHRIYIKRSKLFFIDAIVPKMRDLKFFGISILLGLLMIPIGLAIGLLLAGVGAIIDNLSMYNAQTLTALVMIVSYGIIGVVMCRFMMVLPSRAVDESISFGDAWEATSPVKWKVFFVLSLIPILSSLLTESIASLEGWFFISVSVALHAMFALFELALLSLCYQKLIIDERKREEESVSLQF